MRPNLYVEVRESKIKIFNSSLDEFYWQGFDLLRSRLINDFNEKELIQNHWNDSEFHTKHPMTFD